MRLLSNMDRSTDEQIDQREVILLMDQVANDFARQGLYLNMEDGDRSIGSNYITTFKNVEVKLDEDFDLFYCKLPAKYIELPFNKGINYVCPMQDRANPFIVIGTNSPSMYKNSPAGLLQGRKGCWPEEGKLYFQQEPKVDKVMIKLVITDASSISDDAPYPIDPSMEYKLIQEVVNLFMNATQKPQDKVNDGRQQS